MNQEPLQEQFRQERTPGAGGLSASASVSVGEPLVRFHLHQRFHYQYSAPISNLRQRLLIVPPPEHGPQRCTEFGIQVDGKYVMATMSRDEYGNVVAELHVPRVKDSVEFILDAQIHRAGDVEVWVPANALTDARYLYETRLTTADEAIREAARAAAGEPHLTTEEMAERICHAVHGAIAYQKLVTSVSTTAAEAFALGKGVCQDHAHVMLAMCRSLGIPARYVSGHMLGEGATHAWVEVIVANPDGSPRVVAFDPCYGRYADASYVTVAVGRDYRDAAPASGTYSGLSTNILTSSTWLGPY